MPTSSGISVKNMGLNMERRRRHTPPLPRDQQLGTPLSRVGIKSLSVQVTSRQKQTLDDDN